MEYFIYLIASAAGGLLVGILGTGSSLILLPSLILVFTQAFPGIDAIRLAAGTAMATMAVGAVSGALMQRRAGQFDARLFRFTLLPYAFGALAGPAVSRLLPASALEIYVAALISVVALRMLTRTANRPVNLRRYTEHQIELGLVLLCIGVFCSMAGVASGIFAIPYMSRFAIPLRTVIGTSTASAAVFATFGAIGYVISGWNAPGLPSGHIGFVYMPAFAIMATTSAIIAPFGVRLAAFVNDRILRRTFAIFLLAAAVAMLLG